MLRTEDIDYFVRQVMRDKKNPFMTANCDLARAVHEKVKGRCPQAVIYEDGCKAYICVTKQARRGLLKSYERHRKVHEEQIERIDQMIERIKEDIS